ncbi:MAG: hypothetical protein R3297_09045, partial [Desulfobulbales bacterium]|nr:hypothetical protein [Desulfobulbales bacterium]
MNQQLTDKVLASLDFSHFTRLLSALVPGFSGGAIYDLGSNQISQGNEFSKSLKEEIERFLKKQNFTDAEGDIKEIQQQRLSGDLLLFSHILSNHLSEPVARLIIVVRAQSGVDTDTTDKKITAAIKAIAAIISGEYQLNAEMNAMANELTERYEELNLVYDTTDQARSFSAVKRALRRLVENCCVYMNIPYAAVLLLDRRICIEHVMDPQVIDNEGLLDSKLNRLYGWTM